MSNTFSPLDYTVFAIYCVVIVGLGLYLSRNKKGHERTAQDYFLANKSLTWWAIGASLIAANISAEHFIAMSGSGFAIGLGIAAYEWMAAITLIVVGKYFIPIFIEKEIYTMPQFVNGRFNKFVSGFFAIFWLAVYVFVNLTSVSYLGALALREIVGIPLIWGIIGLLAFSGLYSIYGGLSSVAWTDVIQVIFLIFGGLVTTFLALKAVGGGEILHGFNTIYQQASDHFVMIIKRGLMEVPDKINPETGSVESFKDAFTDLPGLAVLLGAMWITNMGYWGFNQYIIQKGLAAKSMEEAKKGLVFAGYLKILIPLLVIIPGITAYVIQQDPSLVAGYDIVGEINKSDEAYPFLLKNFVPAGVRGLAFAALTAAIVSSLASMINSTSTVFTMDIYKVYINKNANNRQMVRTGRLAAVVALVIAVIVAPALRNLDQVFQYIQEYTGFIYPGVVVVFAMGLFWKQITTRAAIWTTIVTIPMGAAFKLLLPDLPFILRMGYVFIILCTIASVISFFDKAPKVKVDLPDGKEQKDLVRWAIFFGVLGVFGAVFTTITLNTYDYLGIQSLYMLSTLFIMLAIILYTNAKIDTMDKNAIRVHESLFNTSVVFNVAAIGIVAIVAALYIAFWM